MVNITVKDVAGIKDSRGIQENDIILWDEFQFDSTVSDESNIAAVEVIHNKRVCLEFLLFKKILKHKTTNTNILDYEIFLKESYVKIFIRYYYLSAE